VRVAYAVGPRGGAWTALPALPRGTVDVVATARGGYQALAVERTTLVVFDEVGRGAWRPVQRLVVPLVLGSS